MGSITERLKKIFDPFKKDPTPYRSDYLGVTMSGRPERPRLTGGNERTMITSIYNRIAVDVAQIDFRHVKKNEEGQIKSFEDSELQQRLSLDANLDQQARELIQDFVLTMLDSGTGCMAPITTDVDYELTDSYKIYEIRTGDIIEWKPQHVKLSCYYEKDGRRHDLVYRKENVVIVENPFYAVMNAPNSTLRRLVSKLSILDEIDSKCNSNKLDLIIQLPYSIKSPAKRALADSRMQDITDQLNSSEYGIAYIDSTEHITQLNRSVENKLLNQVQYLTELLMSQLGITQGILDGSADEATMNNYYTRIIEVIVDRIAVEMSRKWISKTARSQGQTIAYFRNPFKLVPISQIPDMADKLTRNEIVSTNEIRPMLGLLPSNQEGADELRNKNLNKPEDDSQNSEVSKDVNNNVKEEDGQNE